jgi:plasmid stabilization system protein ParE
MAQKIIWSPEAVADLEQIRDYIARDSVNYALAMVDRVLAVVDGLADFPRSGKRVPEYGDAKIRQMIVGPYRIIYRISPDSIDIAAIIHGARDLRRATAGRSI